MPYKYWQSAVVPASSRPQASLTLTQAEMAATVGAPLAAHPFLLHVGPFLKEQQDARQELARQHQAALWQALHRVQQQRQQQALSPVSPTAVLPGSPQPTLYSINVSEVEQMQLAQSLRGEEGCSRPRKQSRSSNFSIEYLLKKESSPKSPKQETPTSSPLPSPFQLPKAFIYTPPQKYEQGKRTALSANRHCTPVNKQTNKQTQIETVN